jgi:hypothetical protein
MGFRGWDVDYDGIRLPSRTEQLMMICAHCGVFKHAVHFCQARPIRGSGNTYADLHDLCMRRLLHERGRGRNMSGDVQKGFFFNKRTFSQE